MSGIVQCSSGGEDAFFLWSVLLAMLGQPEMMRPWRTATTSLLAATSPAFPKGVHRWRKSRYECDDSDDRLDRHLHLVGQSWIPAELSGQEKIDSGLPPLRRCVGLS